ncbi:hypothetical protein SAMN05421788_102313 [Filimonas lacunae]|uniref:Uncharacterized protein n=1 Tax=Filimonas lacunae TaxID=477680 RepID=A0A1N7NB25_9BACT|nr:hypothetical protein SAMN05421788_102313 [Filimonas lacunae]
MLYAYFNSGRKQNSENYVRCFTAFIQKKAVGRVVVVETVFCIK